MPGQTQTMEAQVALLQYERVWMRIQASEQCSTAEAMKRAQDLHPDIYEQFLNACPRGPV